MSLDAPDKSGGKRTQKVKIFFNFVGDVDILVISEPVITKTSYLSLLGLRLCRFLLFRLNGTFALPDFRAMLHFCHTTQGGNNHDPPNHPSHSPGRA